MTGPAILLLLAGLGAIAWVSARARALRLQAVARTSGRRDAVHSLPGYHGWYVALWTVLPAALFLIIWANVSPGLVTQAVLDDPAAQALPLDSFSRSAILGEARAIATGKQAGAFNPAAQALVAPYEQALGKFGLAGAILALVLAFAGGAYAFTRVRPDFRARTRVERLVMALLLVASLLAIVTTVGIVASLPVSYTHLTLPTICSV